MGLSTLAPGFRFHPTDDELVMYYLKRKLLGKITGNAIAEVNIYDFSPWDLPDKSSLRSGDLEWFFFCPRARKYSGGCKVNRATETGFWKATGKDRKVRYKGQTVAIKKTLVFHRKHAAKGERTDWVMHEYKMEDEHFANAGISQDIQDMYVLCRIFEKSGAGPKNGAQYGAPFNEEEWDDDGGPDGAMNPLNHKQKGPATMNMTVPQSSLSITEPGSSTVTFSANETTSTLNCKQKGPATMNVTVPRSRCTLSVNEPGPSTVTFSANENTNTLNYNQKSSAAVNMTAPQSTHGVALAEPGSSTFTISANERHVDMPFNDDVMLFEDIASIMGVSTEDVNGDNKNKQGVEVGNRQKVDHMEPNEYEHFYDELHNLINLDELNDEAEYTLDRILDTDDLDVDLGNFDID